MRLTEVPHAPREGADRDRGPHFFTHHGFDPRGLARAALQHRSRDRMQGGSTITQQLVKNFFLTPERTLQRKVTELVMAVLLEVHYGKEEILETYLNEIYLGQDRDRAIHGVGLAAQYYFGKEVQHLTRRRVGAAGRHGARARRCYDPHRHPARALERRNLVLRETREQNAITHGAVRRGARTPLGVSRKPGVGTSPYPAFLSSCHRQLRRDYDEADLRSEGPAHLHHARSARAGRRRARPRQAPRAVRQGQALRRARPRGRGGGHRSAERRGPGAGRRARRALSRLQPRASTRRARWARSSSPRSTSPRSPSRRATPWSRRSTTAPSSGRAAARPTGSRRTTTRSSTAWCRCAPRSRTPTTPRRRAWAPTSASTRCSAT